MSLGLKGVIIIVATLWAVGVCTRSTGVHTVFYLRSPSHISVNNLLINGLQDSQVHIDSCLAQLKGLK